MKATAIVKLLQVLGAENISEGDEWVRASCPFAPYPNSGHRSENDSRPSFGIYIGKKSHYYCFACQRSGPVTTMVSALIFLSGKDNIRARRIIAGAEDLSLESFEASEEKELKELVPLPDKILKRYMPINEKHFYMKKRGLDDEAIKHWGLRFDAAESRVLFPVRTEKGELIAVRGRTVVDSKIKMLEYKRPYAFQPPKSHGIWYGQQFVPKDGKKIILVEGEIDAIRLWQKLKRPGIWAAMGASVSRAQLQTLVAHHRHQFVLFFDNDAAGVTATNKVLKALVGTVPGIWVVRNYVGGHDPDEIVTAGKLREALESIEKVG